MHIRVATLRDAGLLSTLAASLFEETFANANTAGDMAMYLAQTFRPELQAAELGDPARRVWIAEDDQHTPIGYAMLCRNSSIDCVSAQRPAEIQRIYAARAFHGGGVGEALMQTCIAQCTQWGCDVVWLAVWQRNPRAIAFYEKNGFRRAGVTTFQLGTDLQHDHVMARSLRETA